MSTVNAYWPAIVAALYLAYVIAAGKTLEIPMAITAFITALGINRKTVAAHKAADKALDLHFDQR
jgi:hypothetical protein